MKSLTSLFLSLALLLTSTAFADDFPAPLDIALTEAEADPRRLISYSMTFSGPEESAVTMRYNAIEKSWTLLEGDPKTLSKELQKRLRNVQKSESVPGGLLYADYRKHLRDIKLSEETDSEWVYSFTPPELKNKSKDGDIENLVFARLHVDKQSGHLSQYIVRTLAPIRPYPATRMEEFIVEQAFEVISPDGPVLLTQLKSRQKGGRLGRKIDFEYIATFHDFSVHP